MKRKFIYLVVLIAVGLFFIWTGFLWKVFSCGFAGSYPCVESWDLKVTEQNLIQIIKEIKTEHPELQPPDTAFTDEKISYWYHILFYYPDTKEVIDTWTRPQFDTTITTFAFVGMSTYKIPEKPRIDSLRIKLGLDNTQATNQESDFKGINRDFRYFENKRQLKKFENKILYLIQQKIKQRQ